MSTEGKKHSTTLRVGLVAITLIAVYLSSLWLTFTDSDRRAFSLEAPAATADHIYMNISVVHVDMLRLEMTTRIAFRLAGRLAQDDITPARDLNLVLNTISGQQEFHFAKGQRINPIESVFPLDGDVNLYPFDRYSGTLWLFATIPEKNKAISISLNAPDSSVAAASLSNSPGLPVSTNTLAQNIHADTKTAFHASLPGLTFRGTRLVESAQPFRGLTGIKVRVQRSNHVLFISIVTMLMMTGLSGGLVTMVLSVVGGRRAMSAFQITMATSLIFGLPALRNIQPGVPPPGTFGDSIVFTWAEMIAAASAVTLIIHWLLRSQRENPQSTL